VKPEASEAVRALADRFGLGADAAGGLERLLGVLTGDARAPTGIADPGAAVDRHLADSLVALELPAVRGAGAIADLGSGAGLPGLPLAIALPRAHVFLVESSRRKCEFLDRALVEVGVENAEVVCGRAEAWPEGRERCHVVSARALAALPVLVEYAAPLLRIGGSLVAWKGAAGAGEEADAAVAAGRLGMAVPEAVPVRPFPGARDLHLYVSRKEAPTPPGFPRRPGIAAKRPLRAA
jgi:16S rRNA (guanine527-N7)-methyltransferase